MIKAAFVSSSENWVWTRQFPNLEPIWNNVYFDFSNNLENCDILFVFDALPTKYCGKIKARKCVFIASEPQNVKVYSSKFLRQFDLIVTTDKTSQHPNAIYQQPGLPWHAGVWSEFNRLSNVPLTFDFFSDYQPKKSKLISVISSDKAFTEEHRARLRFVDALKSHFGDRIDYFGRNICSFTDKMEALSQYKYHISLENCAILDYWTEKLSDPFLTLTYPIYHGCPNVDDYFPEGALSKIDIRDTEESISKIEHIINSSLAEESESLLKESRRRVLFEHNLFSILAKIAISLNQDESGGYKKLESEKFFIKNTSTLRRYRKRLSRRIVNLLGE
ncbi:hypothetical protein HEP89_06810 [Labrenzia sp. 5N]|uniref:glycosyltransferase family 10 domain-containing protein n=1 Tax=Labrenzia sp. 5N TaxID=2723402 RepID=UPI0014472BE7|nr:glycosyltransferase family 10 [Labrenzia sp. 5N]NKX63802.1 hypothetical protein [Labrenzia sp. 5N]